MKKVHYTIVFLFVFNFLSAQVGINTETPKSTLDIEASNQAEPSSDDGVIIPRVSTLNTTDDKEYGLMVFWDSDDADQRGFYWWDGTEWKPFTSISKTTANNSITYVSAAESFNEGNINQNATTNSRTLYFESFKTANPEDFEINATGELVIKKKGYYYVQAVSFLQKKAGDQSTRERFDMKIYINGADASQKEGAGNFNIEGSNAFPVNLNTYISINAAGVLKLDENDRLSMNINRSYRDTGASGNTTVNTNGNARSNMTLRYLGDF